MMSVEFPEGSSFDPAARGIGSGQWMKSLLVAILSLISGCLLGGWLFSRSRQPPEPTVYALVEIHRSPAFEIADQLAFSDSEFLRVMKTQQSLVLAPDVLHTVLLSPTISNIPEIRGRSDPAGWLMAVVRVDLIEGTSLLRISADDVGLAFQAGIINAIAETYTSMARRQDEQEYRSVSEMERSLSKSLRDAREQLRVEMETDPKSATCEALKDQIAVDQALWTKYAGTMKLVESGGGGLYEVILRQRANHPRTL